MQRTELDTTDALFKKSICLHSRNHNRIHVYNSKNFLKEQKMMFCGGYEIITLDVLHQSPLD